MLPLYVASLLVGLGVLVVQITVGHDTGGGHDVQHGDAGHELTPFTVVASIRFWAFALLAFGLVGTLLAGFGLAGRLVVLAVASASGVSAGGFAVNVVNRLLHRSAQSMSSFGDARGAVGRVVVPITPHERGKVRVQVKGNAIDLIARASEELAIGEAVVVEEMSSTGEAQVSRAPKELRP